MLPIVKIENDRGEVLDFSKSPRYVAMLTGTGPPSATINRATVSVADGARYNSARVNERELLLTVHILRDVARARLNLYRFIATKSHIKVYYQADGLDVYIEGYVETAEVNPWEQNQYVQVSIICPMPFWQDVESSYTDASQVARLFEFPFFTDCITRYGLRIYGKTVQNGTPTPDAPVALESAGGNGKITVTAGSRSMDISTPNGLPGIPVTSGGNYTDENGQRWICDEVDFARGVYVQRVLQNVFNGSENWTDRTEAFTQKQDGQYRFALNNPFSAKYSRLDTNVENTYGLSDWGRVKGLHGIANKSVDGLTLYTASQILYVGYITTSKYTSLEELKYGLSNNPLTVLAILETPIETALSAEQLAAYDALEIGDDTALAVSAGSFVCDGVVVADAPGIELSTMDTGAATLIENGGTVETGVTFVITATVISTNPRIHNLSTGEFIGVHATLQPGDQIEICTVTGSKRITHIRDGVRTNYINMLMLGSSWLQMVVGANEYSYTVDVGECELGVYHTNMYTGV